MKLTIWVTAAVLVGATLYACADREVRNGRGSQTMTVNQITAEELDLLGQQRIFFGHQSVGGNIVAGIRELLAEQPSPHLRVVHTAAPWTVDGPAFMETEIGRNGEPAGKTRAFAEAISRGLDEPGAIALHKYCYVDMTENTDVHALFTRYRDRMHEMESAHPQVRFVHVTMPLTEYAPPPLTRFVKHLLGRETELTLNRKRNEFNRLLLAEYGGREAVFDLAALESTRLDGSRTFVRDGTDSIFVLAPEYTSDGGHLTRGAQRMIAARLLGFLAAASRRPLPVASAE